MPQPAYFFPNTFDDVLEASYLISYKESPFLPLVGVLQFFHQEGLMWLLSPSLGPIECM